MGALKYIEELQKKKQSDVVRFLLRVRCWEVSRTQYMGMWTAAGLFDLRRARRLNFRSAKQAWPAPFLLYTR
jgi:large subunit ribosomal protein L15e